MGGKVGSDSGTQMKLFFFDTEVLGREVVGSMGVVVGGCGGGARADTDSAVTAGLR